jgi:AcrR family transcriptional regulator
MPRHPDPLRKPQLLAEIIDYLLDKSLASVSFRTISQALGFSTYTLVYHFGSKSELLREIVAAISTRATTIEELMQSEDDPIGAYFESLDRSWQWTLVPRNRKLQRLEFEAALIESLDPGSHTFSRSVFATWLRIGEDALAGLGIPRADAAVEIRMIVDTFYGIQYDFILNNDVDRATTAYHRTMDRHRATIESMLPLATPVAD